VSLKGCNAVKRLLTGSLFGTRSLQKLDFSLSNVDEIQVKSFNHSKFNTDWKALSNVSRITFGDYSTPYHQHLNYYDEWIKYQNGNLKENISPHTLKFSQVNPEWSEQPFGEILNTEYSAGITLPGGRIYRNCCIIWSIMGAYCGLQVKRGGNVSDYTFNDPRELEKAMWNFATDRSSLKIAIEGFTSASYKTNGDIYHLTHLCDAFGLKYDIYRGYNPESINAFYSALQNGKYIYISTNTSAIDNPFDFHTHAILAYGVKKNGEILVADTGDLDSEVEIYDVDYLQMLPQNMTIESNADTCNYVKQTDGTISTGRSVTFMVLDSK
jgi:hypothetical protein